MGDGHKKISILKRGRLPGLTCDMNLQMGELVEGLTYSGVSKANQRFFACVGIRIPKKGG